METALVRYGAIPEVAKFRTNATPGLGRGEQVVVRTHRGLQLGTILEQVQTDEPAAEGMDVLRTATDDDRHRVNDLRDDCKREFNEWQLRIREWELNLELLEIEKTVDEEKVILYVLNERGPDCTKLALQAAATGLGIIEVQPVDASGLVNLNSHGGCGSGGCCNH